MVHLMDKLHIENGKVQMERQAPLTHRNRIGAAAVTPALLLANHISPPTLSGTEKPGSVRAKPEVCDILTLTVLNDVAITWKRISDCQSQELESSVGSAEVEENVNETGTDDVVGLSTGSLASSSSSSSESRMKNPSSAELAMSMGTLANDCPKPTVSSGAIPKSISFDMTAERGDKELMEDDQKNKRSFFGKLKMSLRNRRGKTIRGTDEIGRYYDREAIGDGVDVGRHRLRRIMSEDVSSSTGNASGGKYCSGYF